MWGTWDVGRECSTFADTSFLSNQKIKMQDFCSNWRAFLYEKRTRVGIPKT